MRGAVAPRRLELELDLPGSVELHPDALGTRERIEAAAPWLKVPESESQSWVAAFEFLQMLRLRVQLQLEQPSGDESLRPAAREANPNLLDIDSLNELDRRLLKEALRMARSMQQRIELDWMC